MDKFKIKYYNSKLKRLELESEKELLTICEDYFLIANPKEDVNAYYYSINKNNLKLTNDRYYNLIIDSILEEEDFEHIIECILCHKLKSYKIERVIE